MASFSSMASAGKTAKPPDLFTHQIPPGFVRSSRPRSFLLEDINRSPAQPKNPAATSERPISRAGTGVEDIKPLVWRELGRTLADLYHPPVRGEADVDDDLLRVHTFPILVTLSITGRRDRRSRL